MKRYISYSEYWTFYNKGKAEYYKNYILGIREKPSEPQIFGTIVHAILADPDYDWQTEIKKLTKYPQDTYKRIIEKILKSVPTCEEREVSVFADCEEFSLYAGIDGVDDDMLTEYKTGQKYWTQEEVNEHEQITHYLLTWEKDGRPDLPFRLISINSRTGNFIEFRTHRTKKQLEEYYKKLLNFKEELIKLGWWDKKCKFNDRIQL